MQTNWGNTATVSAMLFAVAAGLPGMSACRAPQAQPAVVTSPSGNPEPVERTHGHIENLIEVVPGLLSGSAPEGDAGFAELQRRGVRTIVSVDGARPDVEAAHRHGMRYVHLPVGYHGIERDRQLEIARAVRDLPGPVFVHCHHGRHRGPAAAASAAVALGRLDADRGVAFMKQAGTSSHYAGLYQCVQELQPADERALQQARADFPEIAPVPDFVRAMSDAQAALDHLVEIRDSGWRTPPTHPDLVPVAEAARLAGLMQALQDDTEPERQTADFAERMKLSVSACQELERAMSADAPQAELTSALQRVNNACKACHEVYRNKR